MAPQPRDVFQPRRRTPALLGLYAGLGVALQPLALPLLVARARRGKEDPARRAERLGRDTRPRPAGRLVWVHAASVGELVSVLPLLEWLAAQGSVLVTTGTLTSARVARERLPAGALHAFVPLDMPGFVRRFLGHWRPDLAVFVESELWPGMVRATHRTGTPLALVNARLSARSARRWARLPGTIAALLGCFDLCLAQSQADAERLRDLGARHSVATGNLKIDAEPPPADPEALASLRAAIGARPVLVAASTHPGEETVVAEAHRRLLRRVPDLLTIVVPRHPDRGPELSVLLGQDGRLARRSAGELPSPDVSIYLADTLGELGVMYRLAHVAVLGGSFVPRGGHNPVEPIRLGVPVLHGPSSDNFAELYAALERRGGSATAADAFILARQAGRVLEDSTARQTMARAAEAVIQQLSGALARTQAALQPLLDGAAHRRERS